MTLLRHSMCVSIVLVAAFTAYAGEDRLSIRGAVAARSVFVKGQPSWLEGGFGRLGSGADDSGDEELRFLGSLNVGAELHLTPWLEVHAHGVGHGEPQSYGGRSAGLAEGYIDVRLLDGERNGLRLRTGMFFLRTSRENVGELWSSPYTITLSALNSWIADEVRPQGSEIEYRYSTEADRNVILAASAFVGNDSSGALLAWRGWALGSRVATYGEVLPLPPLFSLRDPRFFGDQRDDGTRSFGPDHDGRPGWTARARFQVPDRFMLQIAYFDNRGDRDLHRGEYAWRTRFVTVGSDWRITERTTIAAELMSGSTGMGFRPGPQVQADLYTAYVLVSHRQGRHRVSLRLETFQTDDRDGSSAERNDERGSAVTSAYFYELSQHFRLGLELLNVSGARPAAGQSAFDPDTSGRAATLELKLEF